MQCKSCGATSTGQFDFCPNCGVYIKHHGAHRLHVPNFHRQPKPVVHDDDAEPEPPEPQQPQPKPVANEKVMPESASQLPGAIPERRPRRVARPAPQPANVPSNLPAPLPVPPPDSDSVHASIGSDSHAVQQRGLSVTVLSRALGRPLTNVRIVKKREPFPTYAGLIVFMGVWLVALLAGFGAAGIYQGMQDRTRIALDNAEQHKQAAKQYIQQGNLILATEELKYARQFNPNDPEILALLTLLQATPTPVRTPTLPLSNPTLIPTPTATATRPSPGDVAGTLFAQAKTAYDAKDYATASAALENLRRVQPDFNKSEVDDMLYNSYLALARQYLSEQRYEEAVQHFDKALAIRKNDDVALERYLAANYLDGISSWDADWQRAINAFAEIVKINPDYLDSRTRLYQAYIAYGDYLVKLGTPCNAVTQYDQALPMGQTAQLQAARDQAASACASGGVAVVAATPRPGAVVSPIPARTQVPTPSGSGKYTVQSQPTWQATNDDTGSIRGQVLDKTGHSISHLEMTVTSTTKKYQRVETTDDFGFYGFDGLDPDTYTVRVANDPASTSAPVTVGRKLRAVISFTQN